MRPNELWHDATPDASVENVTSLVQYVVTENVIQTVATESVEAGVIDYYAMWYPLSSESSLTAA